MKKNASKDKFAHLIVDDHIPTLVCPKCGRTIRLAMSRGTQPVLQDGVIISETRVCGFELMQSCAMIVKGRARLARLKRLGVETQGKTQTP